MVPRIISLVVLIAIVLLFGLLFYQVMIGFLMPIFIAVLTAVLFQSVFDWILPRVKNSRNLAALATTLLVFLLIMVPTVLVGIKAYGEAHKIYLQPEKFHLDQETMNNGIDFVNRNFGFGWTPEGVQSTVTAKAKLWLAPVAQTTVSVFLEFITGLVIMLIALYYFLLDGEEMLSGIGKLLPVDGAYQRTFLHEFAQVSRAVATATLVSAIAQGFLGGIGYYFAGLESIWLLIIATMLASLVPFVGATIVWIPCCVYLYYFKGSLSGAIFLAIYGFGVVSMVDNLIKPWILQGRTKLHPLLALLSVLGGVQALGPIGIFVGPMAVVFFQAALVMLQAELKKDPVGIYKTAPTPSITS